MSSSVELDDSLKGARIALEEIPVIDFADFLTGDLAQRRAVARRIGTACRDIGFFYLVNHGIAPALMTRTFAEAKRFFDQPLDAKMSIDIEKSPCHRGYFKMGGENLDPKKQKEAGDLKEGVKIGRDLAADHPMVQAGLPLHGPNLWPQNLPGWQGAMQSYFDALSGLGRQIMHAFALSLDLDECHFDRDLSDPMATLGPLHYPPQRGAITEAQIGAGAHTDFGCLTILAQDMNGGLQVRNAAGVWIDAPPLSGAFVINIGDMMARWTNDLFASTQHRVVNVSGAERYSIPFFFDPNFQARVEALPSCSGPDRPAKFAPTTSGQHLLDMINATFDYHREKAEST
ncbi:isopenicillin N synthase family oxygenase [Pelagibius litoralis]|uniref:Isopenicillin N synthase family oxygenase n=1 Tax=Pelagibius litoralis TaxID=374515 RepID=A0A967EXL5_9PROT|nr:isopenicillin N synthase family oxygenase [Pelagibius litoralis]NIA69277.1 isopenicillin N synthase family oxygenase [Pelagibius litoralis]